MEVDPWGSIQTRFPETQEERSQKKMRHLPFAETIPEAKTYRIRSIMILETLLGLTAWNTEDNLWNWKQEINF